MSRKPLLIEIGCEEIPARMIRAAAAELERRVVELLVQAGLSHGEASHWGGPRRIAVRVEAVQARQPDREEQLLGPPVKLAFDERGQLGPAGLGFAKKQGIDPSSLGRVTTDRGEYVGFTRQVEGKTVGDLLAQTLPAKVEGMSFPKTMRWGDGRWRWVRPVHWVLALHGREVLPLELFGVRATSTSVGHRFLNRGAVKVSHPNRYHDALERAHVLVDPARRRGQLEEALHEAANTLGGRPVEDADLLDEIADLVEWPGVVVGRFAEAYLELPREILVTTLRHHQKCFSIQGEGGTLLPGFVAVANTDRDPGGHIRRGNEWVIGGRLEDARFFWREDLRRPLADRAGELEGVVFHARSGSFADKAERVAGIAERLAAGLGLEDQARRDAAEAAGLAKIDLVTGTVGEFPELQGQVGGLMLLAEGRGAGVARGVYEHYLPAGPDDPVAPSIEGAVVAVSDKLDTIAELMRVGQTPTGSKDPFGLRRAGIGIFRTAIEKNWALSLNDLTGLVDTVVEPLGPFLLDRFRKFLRDDGYTSNEIQAVFRPGVSAAEALGWPLPDIVARLEAIRGIRQRSDFAHLADLTKRVDNILSKGEEAFRKAGAASGDGGDYVESSPAALALVQLVQRNAGEMARLEEQGRFVDAVGILAEFVDPVERFFDDVLVLDPDRPEATLYRRELLSNLRGVLTRCFDIRELAGQAERRTE